MATNNHYVIHPAIYHISYIFCTLGSYNALLALSVATGQSD